MNIVNPSAMITNGSPSVSGEIIRRLRQLKGIKQTDAAKKLGITQQAYSKIESCRIISENKIAEILKAFNLTRQDLDNIISLFTPPPINNIGLHLC